MKTAHVKTAHVKIASENKPSLAQTAHENNALVKTAHVKTAHVKASPRDYTTTTTTIKLLLPAHVKASPRDYTTTTTTTTTSPRSKPAPGQQDLT